MKIKLTKEQVEGTKLKEGQEIWLDNPSAVVMTEASNDVTDTMVNAYLEAALWSSTDYDTDEAFDDNYGVYDVDKDSRREAEKDLAIFIRQAKGMLNDVTDEMVGHDFWLTRNGHGAGFWDRDIMFADELSDIATSFRGKDLFAQDNQVFIESIKRKK